MCRRMALVAILFFTLMSQTICGISIADGVSIADLKILHISFQQGCVDEIQELADEYSVDVTSWYILSEDLPREHFDGVTTDNGVYNLTYERAAAVWEKHKNYFNQFDAILTSDTAPLSRIFLQNGWTKPLVIWVCNRFDYCDRASLDGVFPDQEYYDLIQAATKKDNVQIIANTAYESVYALNKGVDIGRKVIKPLGIKERPFITSDIPAEVDKESTIFIYPRLNDQQLQYVQSQCDRLGITTHSGRYNGPDDLTDFKAVLYFPYDWTNLALFENLQRGVVHFVPSESFILQEKENVRHVTLDQFSLVEWYSPEYKSLFVYFDSWKDLKNKVATTRYNALAKKVQIFSRAHKRAMIGLWRAVLKKVARQVDR